VSGSLGEPMGWASMGWAFMGWTNRVWKPNPTGPTLMSWAGTFVQNPILRPPYSQSIIALILVRRVSWYSTMRRKMWRQEVSLVIRFCRTETMSTRSVLFSTRNLSRRTSTSFIECIRFYNDLSAHSYNISRLIYRTRNFYFQTICHLDNEFESISIDFCFCLCHLARVNLLILVFRLDWDSELHFMMQNQSWAQNLRTWNMIDIVSTWIRLSSFEFSSLDFLILTLSFQSDESIFLVRFEISRC
jgi:hypothetical protein